MHRVGAFWCDFIRVIGAAFMRGLSPLIRGWTSGPFQGPSHDTLTDCSSFSRCGVANKQARGSQLANVIVCQTSGHWRPKAAAGVPQAMGRSIFLRLALILTLILVSPACLAAD